MVETPKRMDRATEKVGTAVLIVVASVVIVLLARFTELPMIARIVIAVVVGMFAAGISTAIISAARRPR